MTSEEFIQLYGEYRLKKVGTLDRVGSLGKCTSYAYTSGTTRINAVVRTEVSATPDESALSTLDFVSASAYVNGKLLHRYKALDE